MAQAMQHATSKIGKDFRITLPKAVRDVLKVEPGDYLTWTIDDSLVSVRKSIIVRCPYCGCESPLANFTPIRKPWKFRFYIVRRLKCPTCGEVFNYYRGKAPSGKVIEYTTRKRRTIGD